MSKIEDTLKERGSIYGKYSDNAITRANILLDLKGHYINIHGKDMPTLQQVWISDLIMKLVRLNGSSSHTDSAHDLAGYSTLIENMLDEANSHDAPTRD